ncbi:hypothetical protein AURDEDRAFT_163658 [Auricularia subglabra TFB-10046 SS5]|nr:hypothetical protein AURDEDRAFT_163658 [Auricularia subglabra TFB-10046 SS5]
MSPLDWPYVDQSPATPDALLVDPSLAGLPVGGTPFTTRGRTPTHSRWSPSSLTGFTTSLRIARAAPATPVAIYAGGFVGGFAFFSAVLLAVFFVRRNRRRRGRRTGLTVDLQLQQRVGIVISERGNAPGSRDEAPGPKARVVMSAESEARPAAAPTREEFDRLRLELETLKRSVAPPGYEG